MEGLIQAIISIQTNHDICTANIYKIPIGMPVMRKRNSSSNRILHHNLIIIDNLISTSVSDILLLELFLDGIRVT